MYTSKTEELMCFQWRWTSLKTALYGRIRERLAQDDQNDVKVGMCHAMNPFFGGGAYVC